MPPVKRDERALLRRMVQTAVDAERAESVPVGIGLLARIIHQAVIVIVDAIEKNR